MSYKETVRRECRASGGTGMSDSVMIFAFYSMNGIPLVIDMNYGITDGSLPETHEDIYVMFSTSKIDVLFVENLLISKE